MFSFRYYIALSSRFKSSQTMINNTISEIDGGEAELYTASSLAN